MNNPPPIPTPNTPASVSCPACRSILEQGVLRCRFCGEDFRGSNKSNGLAAVLSLFLGPLGLWYKGCWGAGFAWIAGVIIIMVATGGLGILLVPFFWIGMAVHAYNARPKP